jgi:hypothetical protein
MEMGRSHRSFVTCCVRLLAASWLLLLCASVSKADLVNDSKFYCGDDVLGNLNVRMSDRLFAGNPIELDKPTKDWSLLGGADIRATATPAAGVKANKLAWLQAVLTDESGQVVQDRTSGVDLVAPFPDTPPGGYKLPTGPHGKPRANPVIQAFDNEPWYANYKPGDLKLSDKPRSYTNLATGQATNLFESWLVCFKQKGDDGTYEVIPLIGFTWGFTFKLDTDKDGSGIIGDKKDEYSSSTNFGGFVAGTAGPSDSFKTGYAKYFKLSYLANNEENCKDCIMAVPGAPMPASLPMGLACVLLLFVIRKSRRATAI